MSAYLAGLAILRCAEHDRAAELDPTARLVLAVMASFAGSEDAPQYFGALSSVAERAGLDRATVRRALLRLEKLSVVERAGKRGKTVRWDLTLLVGRAPHKSSPLVGQSAPQGPNGAQRPTSDGAQRPTSDGAQRPTILPTPPDRQGVEGGGRSGAPARPASADAAAGAPAPSNGPVAGDETPALVREVMAARGGTAEQAQKWIDRKINAASAPVRNEVAFIRGCLAKETAAPAAAKSAAGVTPPAKKTTAGKPARKTAVRATRPAGPVTLTLRLGDRTIEQTAPADRSVEVCAPDGTSSGGWRWGSLRPGQILRGTDQRKWTIVDVSQE